MADYNEFKKRDKSEKVTVIHIEPVRQLIRWTDEGGQRYSKLLTTSYWKTNSRLIGMLREQEQLLDYDNFNFLEDQDGNPFLTHDDQFFFVET